MRYSDKLPIFYTAFKLTLNIVFPKIARHFIFLVFNIPCYRFRYGEAASNLFDTNLKSD
ncbi:hypothetical protein PAHA111176_04100 [Parendozoicomonas haliclonae]|uniref:Uncharacterized protein n=1 Tax=Parendozoicomonas haliclonae TaxID=1960125 RepID=A0A1X7AJH0_9GAMM|nr:hypothetical protein EHSB41UT_02183 [Parendozoicomonas haliclonae]